MLNLIYITLFPIYFKDYFKVSLSNKAILKGFINFFIYNIHDFSLRHKADDYPYGGGRGMLIKIDPLIKALSSSEEKNGNSYIILLCPQGKIFDQNDVKRILEKKNVTFICGHYEGFDQRINNYIDEKISIGSFITMGGELPALVITECLIRAIPGFIKKESFEKESFSSSKFDHDSYTRPLNFEGFEVPTILFSGNHQAIETWRKENSKKKKFREKHNSLKLRKNYQILTNEDSARKKTMNLKSKFLKFA